MFEGALFVLKIGSGLFLKEIKYIYIWHVLKLIWIVVVEQDFF